MNPTRIFIAVACHNRRRTAELCLPTLRGALGNDDHLVLYDDGSAEYDAHWLRQWGDRVVATAEPIGIEAQRVMHLRDFWRSDAQFLYFTDHDCIHDPDSLNMALDLHHHWGGLVCLYDTKAHSGLHGNTTHDKPDYPVIIRRYAPGVSLFMSREKVGRVMQYVESLTAFDWQIPDILGNNCTVSRRSYIDHLGVGGIRHPASEGADGGDRATNPTPWLVAKRAEIVAALSA